MKSTCLINLHIELNAKMVEYAGFNMPISYTSISEEHLKVRENVGMFDVSHMGEILIKGRDANKFVNYLLTSNITFKNKAQYGLLCNEDGYILDDLMTYSLKDDEYLLVCNASNKDKDLKHIINNQKGFDVEVIDQSDYYQMIAVQGPNAVHKLSFISDKLSNLTFMEFDFFNYNNEKLLISRSGYTGEDGFEIYASSNIIVHLFEKLLKDGVSPIGLGARDTLRFEAALPLYGNEMSEDISPFDTSLGFAVSKKKENFIGKNQIFKLKDENNLTRVGLKLLSRGILRSHYKIFYENNEIGYTTSGYLIPNHESSLAFAIINKDFAKIGTILQVEVRNKLLDVEVVDKKFYEKKYIKGE